MENSKDKIMNIFIQLNTELNEFNEHIEKLVNGIWDKTDHIIFYNKINDDLLNDYIYDCYKLFYKFKDLIKETDHVINSGQNAKLIKNL